MLGQKPKASITSFKTNIRCASEPKGLVAHAVGQKPGSRASTRTLLRFNKDERVVMMSIKTNTRCAANADSDRPLTNQTSIIGNDVERPRGEILILAVKPQLHPPSASLAHAQRRLPARCRPTVGGRPVRHTKDFAVASLESTARHLYFSIHQSIHQIHPSTSVSTSHPAVHRVAPLFLATSKRPIRCQGFPNR